jgi:hypothetical protein
MLTVSDDPSKRYGPPTLQYNALIHSGSSDQIYVAHRFKRHLMSITDTILSWINGSTDEVSQNSSTYNGLLISSISEDCSSASLCLREMWKESESVHPDDFPPEEKAALSDLVGETLGFLRLMCEGIAGGRLLLNRDKAVKGFYVKESIFMSPVRMKSIWIGSKELPRITCRFLARLNALFVPAAESGFYACSLKTRIKPLVALNYQIQPLQSFASFPHSSGPLCQLQSRNQPLSEKEQPCFVTRRRCWLP